jgi:teichoic acid transport system permease protein
MSSDKSVDTREPENQFTTTHHVYEPHKGGIPPVVPYLTELWRRKEFAAESSRANLRAANTLTVFGQLWMVLNPLLLAGVYYFVVTVIAGGAQGMTFFAHMTSGLFAFYFLQGAMSAGAGSVVGGGKLLLNTAFPRLLLPYSSLRTAWFRFLPTIPVYFIFHLLAGAPISWVTLLAIPFLLFLGVFAMGLAALFATLQVYFRDTASFLPYVNRIWLYLSPVLWTIDDLPARLVPWAMLNPLFSILGGYREALVDGVVPSASTWFVAIGWSVAALVIGSLFFMSREREFAVRI